MHIRSQLTWLKHLLILPVAISAVLLIPFSSPGMLSAQEETATESVEQEEAAEEDDEKEEAEKKPETIVVETEELLATIKTSGVFISTEADQVIVDPEAWTSLKVVEAVSHGASVMEGDAILTLETEDLDEAIEKAKRSLESTEVSLQLAKDELRFLKESTAMDLESTERSASEAEADLDYYLEVEEAEDIKSAELRLKFAEYSLEYAQEELDQLQQMYEADDLTEQTEEIVLLRAKRTVEMAERSVERAKLARDRQLETLIPRQKTSMQDRQARTELAKAKAVTTLPQAIKKQELDVEELEFSFEEKQEKLNELLADQAASTIVAPRSGIVYYGKETHGDWTEVAARSKQLIPGGSISAGSVVMTVVDPDELSILADLTEEQIAVVRQGQLALVNPKATSNTRFYAQVKEITPVAQSDKKYKATLRLRKEDIENENIVPGMSCEVKIRIKKVDEAIMVPTSVIQRDDFTENDQPYVWLAGEEPEKRYIELGLERDDKQEVVDGLEAGDEILKEAPEE